MTTFASRAISIFVGNVADIAKRAIIPFVSRAYEKSVVSAASTIPFNSTTAGYNTSVICAKKEYTRWNYVKHVRV